VKTTWLLFFFLFLSFSFLSFFSLFGGRKRTGTVGEHRTFGRHFPKVVALFSANQIIQFELVDGH